MEKFRTSFLFLLRLVIGWHLLYEGLIKLFTPGWTSAAYLEGSYGFLSGFFHSLAMNPAIVSIVDFLNIFGLILIGTGLFLGILTRFTALAGIFLLFLYYFAYPPFGSQLLNFSQEGHYWIINRNMIEIIALGIIWFFPVPEYSLMSLIKALFTRKTGETTSPADSNKRRELLKGLVSLPFLGGVIYSAAARSSKDPDSITGATRILTKFSLKDLKAPAPKGKLGNLEISRIIGGCNQIMGFSHARDLSYVDDLFRHYNTEMKLFETFSLYEQAGINTTNMVVDAYPVFNKYKKAFGSNMNSICQVHLSAEDLYTEINQSIDFGATCMYIQGGNGDALIYDKRFDVIHKVIEYIRSKGMLAGMGSHSIQGPIACEREGIRPDFYFKTMHHDKYWSATPFEFREEFRLRSGYPSQGKGVPDRNKYNDNMFDLFPEQTIEVFSKIDVPLIGFKVMAGGAIKPKDGFRYAFENGADFICVGMFDWQVIQNVNLINEVLNSKLNRTRPWYS